MASRLATLNLLRNSQQIVNSTNNPLKYSILKNKNSVLNTQKSKFINTVNFYRQTQSQTNIQKVQQLLDKLDIKVIENPFLFEKTKSCSLNVKIIFKLTILQQTRLLSSDHEIIEILYQEISHQSQYLKQIDSLTKQKAIQEIIRNYKKLKSTLPDLQIAERVLQMFDKKGWFTFDVYNKINEYNSAKQQNKRMEICLDQIQTDMETILGDGNTFFRYTYFMKYQMYYPNKFVLYLEEDQWVSKIIKMINQVLKYLFFK